MTEKANAMQRVSVNIPQQLARELKAAAALRGDKFADYCTQIFMAGHAPPPNEDQRAA